LSAAKPINWRTQGRGGGRLGKTKAVLTQNSLRTGELTGNFRKLRLIPTFFSKELIDYQKNSVSCIKFPVSQKTGNFVY